jgi:NADH dehydrogenase
MTSVVTGAFGYTGRYITRRLLAAGEPVRTITTRPDRPNPFGQTVKAFPYNFDKPAELTATLRGAATLYNTYWVRFDYGGTTFRQAIDNSETLFRCAKDAGIQKIIHISVTRCSPESPLPYFAGKAALESALANVGVSYSIVRPTLIFGKEDILVNNIAWLLRKFPIFPIFGSGGYRIQPVFVEDLAAVALDSAQEQGSITIDAIGPEVFSFQEFVQLIASRIRPRVRLLHVPPGMGIALGRLIGLALRDIILTQDEVRGLMDNLLISDQTPNGPTRFSDWLAAHTHELGTSYSSELGRHYI